MPFKLKPKARARTSQGSRTDGHAIDERGRRYFLISGGLPAKCLAERGELTDEEFYEALKSVNEPRRVYLDAYAGFADDDDDTPAREA